MTDAFLTALARSARDQLAEDPEYGDTMIVSLEMEGGEALALVAEVRRLRAALDEARAEAAEQARFAHGVTGRVQDAAYRRGVEDAAAVCDSHDEHHAAGAEALKELPEPLAAPLVAYAMASAARECAKDVRALLEAAPDPGKGGVQ